jgi:cation transport ATPase
MPLPDHRRTVRTYGACATTARWTGGTEIDISVDQVRAGEIVIVRPASRFRSTAP